jgi:hypothetical protein
MKKYIVWFVLIGACISGAVYWYSYTKEVSTPVSMAVNAIPVNAAIIVECKQSKSVSEKVTQKNIIWEELRTTEFFSKLHAQLRTIDSLISQNKSVEQLLNNNSVYISAHVSGAHSFDFLYTLSLPTIRDKSTAEDFFNSIKNSKVVSLRNYDGISINTLSYKNKDSLNFAFLNGVLMMSSSQNLVESAIRQLKSGASLKADAKINKILRTSGKNVDANIYINYKYLPDVLNRFASPSCLKSLKTVSAFAYFSGWDIRIKPNAVMLSGFTETENTETGFLNLFRKQKSQEIKLTKIIPDNTSLIMFWGISNIKGFYHDYKKHIAAKNYSQSYIRRIDEIDNKYHVNIVQSLLEWINKEMALVVTQSNSGDFSDNTFAVFHSGDIESTAIQLFNLTDTINKKDKLKLDTVNFNGHTIVHINLPEVLPQLLGSSFANIKNTYYCVIDDYIVFGNSKEALKSFINSYKNERTLENDKNYKDFAENMSSEAGVYYYSSIARSTGIYKSFLNEELAQEIETHTELFQKFEAVGVQFSMNNNLLYSNAYISYNPLRKEQNTALWETKLEASVSSRPYLLINHKNKTKDVFVQDDANKIYLISNTGKISWSKQLSEKIMSDVTQIDMLKNGKLQMIFNTRSEIHALDRNGNEMSGFPVKLKSNATAPISIMDYDNNRNYRIFVSCESKKILCYEISGKELKGFMFDKTKSVVRLPLQYFKVNNKEHLCAVDEEGRIYLFNRKGEAKEKITERLTNAHDFFVEVGRDEKNTYIIGADSIGNVMKMNLKNEKENFELDDVEAISFFNYVDIAGADNAKEYLIAYGNSLKAFSANKTLLFEHEFKSSVSQAPFVIDFGKGNCKIGVVLESSGELFLLNNDGSIYQGFPLEGKTLFSIADMNNDGSNNVVAGTSFNSIFAYQLEQNQNK